MERKEKEEKMVRENAWREKEQDERKHEKLGREEVECRGHFHMVNICTGKQNFQGHLGLLYIRVS
jgi:hypothetical protein